jgi:hypothetical protein
VSPRRTDALTSEVIGDLEAGKRIYECVILSEGDAWIEGAMQEGEVWVNPAPNVLETVFHEILHRLYPSWAERTVISRSRKILRGLSDTEVERLYGVYLRVARKSKKRR